jgi:hypothetical protein
MKKINFAALFHNSAHDRTSRLLYRVLILTIIGMVCGALIIHGAQAYKWYQLHKQYNEYKKQEGRYQGACTVRSGAEQKQQQLRDKMASLRKHQAAQERSAAQLEALFAIPYTHIRTAHLTDKRFNLELTAPTKQKALSLLQTLKQQPLVHKAKIHHLAAHAGACSVTVQGTWKAPGS